jgi:catabolite regulation protein CreA
MKQERTVDKTGPLLDPSMAYVNNADGMTYFSREIVIEALDKKDLGAYTCHSEIDSSKSASHVFYLQNVRENETDAFIENEEFQGHPVISVQASHGKKVHNEILLFLFKR